MTTAIVPNYPEPVVIRPTVVEQLARVMAEMPSIGKDGRASQQQGGYSYRGIEQVAAHASTLLAKYGVVFTPQVRKMETRDLTVNGKPWTDTILTVRYRIHGPAGDYIDAQVIGIGRDNSDKGANKALTQAFKYALLQVLCIADGKDDGDRYTQEAEYGGPVDRVTGEVAAGPLATEDIGAMKPRELHDACVLRGLDAEGSVPDLRDRLYHWSQEQASGMGGSRTPGDDEGSGSPLVTAPSIPVSEVGAGMPPTSGDPQVHPVQTDSSVSGKGDADVHPGTLPAPALVSGDAGLREDSGAVDGASSSPDTTPPGAVPIPDSGKGYEAWKRRDLIIECAERDPVIDTLSNATITTLVEQLRAWDRRFKPDTVEWESRAF